LTKEFEAYKCLYSNLPLEEKLYSKIIYIHKKNITTDVDNISKPFVDAFKGIIYQDDILIDHRTCSKIKLEDLGLFELNLSVLPTEISERFSQLLESQNEHIVYYEIGIFSEDMVFIGGGKHEA